MNGENSRACPRNEQAVGWVLHALEPAEEAGLAQHLATCASCREVVQDTEQVLGALGASVEQTDPPPRLRHDILSRAAGTPQASARRDARPAAPAGPRPPGGAAGRGPAGRTGGAGRGPRRAQGPTRRGLLVGASLALVAVLGMTGLGVYTAQLQHQRDAEIVRAQSLADLLVQSGQPGTTQATLATDDGRPVAAVVVADGHGTVVTAGLDPNDRASTIYVVWGINEGSAPEPLGSFDTGTDAGVFPIGATGGYSTYAISLEPGRTMPAAPTTVVAAGKVST
jgi:anti-sigma-K factor RskA